MYFKDIIGQEEIKNSLSIQHKQVLCLMPIIHGTREVRGAFPLALAYGRYLNCTHRTETDACGTCPSCLKFNELAHPDLHFLYSLLLPRRKKKKKYATII